MAQTKLIYPITPNQLKMVHTLFSKKGISDKSEKAELIKQASDGRTESSRELNAHEAGTLINMLSQGAKATPSKGDKMRGKILSMAHEMRWELPNGKVDMARLDAWCIKYGAEHLPFNAYPENKLALLVTAFERVYKGYIEL